MNGNRQTRREILAATAAAALAGAAGAADKSEDKLIPIIDTHQHLWDLSRFKLPWLVDEPKLKKSYLPADYHEATKGLKVVKAVYMEVDVAVEQQQAEVDYIVELCKSKKSQTVAAVVSGRPGSEQFADYAKQFKDGKYVKGIRQVLHPKETPAGYCLQKTFVKSMQLLGEMNLCYDICMRPEELGDGIKLVDLCPETRFVLDHCGNADVQSKDPTQWKRDIEAIAKRKNVVCKISGIVASAKPDAWSSADLAPIVNHCLDSFGPDRVIFGGDWPVCTLAATFKQWVVALKEIVVSRPLSHQRKLFHDNAAKYYGLEA